MNFAIRGVRIGDIFLVVPGTIRRIEPRATRCREALGVIGMERNSTRLGR